MVGTKISKKLNFYGFWPKIAEISGFLPFPVLASTRLNICFAWKVSLSDKTTFKQKRKVCTPVQLDEIDEIQILPYTTCMVAIFDKKFLST